MAAMQHWMERTCLTFQRYDPLRHSDYILFTPDKCGCCSHVGRKGGGAQIISIGERCDKLGIVVHEIGHVVGFWHEHTRPDRDEFVDVVRENILKGQDYNFDKAKSNEIDSLHETYDYHSIMHYARDTFSKQKGLDTIRPKGIYSNQMAPFIGQRLELSRGDIRQTNKLYHCPRCFQTFASSTGRLYTDGDCADFVWRIISSEGQNIRINLTLSKIFSNSTEDCDHNTTELLRIRDGGSLKSSVVKEYCNSKGDVTFTSYNSKMILELRSQKTPGKVLIGKFTVDCGGLIEGSRGLLESPNWPNPYSEGLNCLWVIRVPAGYRVAVRFSYFQLESQKDCLYDRLDIYETHLNKTEVLATLCGTSFPDTIATKNSNEVIIKFSSDQSIQKNGFQLEYLKEIDECLSGANKCEQKCKNEIGGYTCECYMGYRLNEDGFSCVETCGGVISSPKGIITSPNWPEDYDADSSCIWKLEAPENHQIFLTIHNYSIEGLNSECSYDFLKISRIDIAPQNETFIKLCGEESDVLSFRSASNSLLLEFNSDSSMQKTGFFANYVFDLDECKITSTCSHICENTIDSYVCTCPEGMVLSEDTVTCREEKCTVQINEANGLISSVKMEEKKSNECFYHLITTPGHQLVLTFQDFHFDSSCLKDHIDVYDGADLTSSNLIGKLCGGILPPTVTSSGNELLLAVYLNNFGEAKGFNASFKSECGGQISVERSPGYIYSHTGFGDSKYFPSMDCRWELSKSPNLNSGTTVIRLLFKHFLLESDENCDYDYVQVSEREDYGDWTTKSRFCGRTPIRPVFSTKKHLMLRFVSDRTFEDKGFIIEYSMIDLSDDVITTLNTTEDSERAKNLVVYE
ncbi:unnamed protein product [Bursaphelenchus xylophilus]|uniref:Metalloendopeptidase n=1 Tax=Bursaphelenchus xylophilus TaxID=6326 RepID=A0A1I7RI67_BURXY|nr:unnamed protein product [Bursaphelenchus xylophilus]CAG9115121.1 unnamed protein product [Bursaphelenchus xylophilus]